MTERLAAEIFREASESIEVLAPPYDGVVVEAREQRRRIARTVVAGVVAVAVVIGGLTWLVNRGQPVSDDLRPARVVQEANPVGVAWYADGRLHLEKVVVAVPALTELIELNGGAVYSDEEGTVAYVAADGQRRLIGHQAADSPLIASSQGGLVTWVDPGDPDDKGGAGRAMLRVYDANAGTMLDSRNVPATGVRPIAIDQNLVYYEEPDGTMAWSPGGGSADRQDRNGLLDVESGNRVYQVRDTIEMVQSFFSVSFVRPGTGAQLSPGGILVLSKVSAPGVADGLPFQPILYDARSGDRMPSGVGPDERVIDATFGRNHTVVYLVAPQTPGDPNGLVVLRTCDLSTAKCTDVAAERLGTGQPLLAQ